MAAPAEQLQSVTVFQRVARSCFMKTPVCILDFFWPANPDAASYSGLCVCVWFTCLVQRNFHISSPCLSHLTRLSWRPPLPRPPHLWGCDRTNAGRCSLRERAWCRWCPTSTCLPAVCLCEHTSCDLSVVCMIESKRVKSSPLSLESARRHGFFLLLVQEIDFIFFPSSTATSEQSAAIFSRLLML